MPKWGRPIGPGRGKCRALPGGTLGVVFHQQAFERNTKRLRYRQLSEER